jgi:transposase-like protein
MMGDLFVNNSQTQKSTRRTTPMTIMAIVSAEVPRKWVRKVEVESGNGLATHKLSRSYGIQVEATQRRPRVGRDQRNQIAQRVRGVFSPDVD